MGSSTALHLLRQGYNPSNITVLDTYPIPSSQSAGNDLNKIMGVRLRNKVDLQLSLEARDMWRNDPLFKQWFHNTGRLDCAGQPDSLRDLRKSYQDLLDSDSDLKHTTEWLDDEDAILRKAPLLSREQIKVGRTAWIPLTTGLESDMERRRRMARCGQGDQQYRRVPQGTRGQLWLWRVSMQLSTELTSSAGSFKRPLLSADGRTCIGVETVDGTKYHADKVVLAAGAWTSVLVDLDDQCVSKVSRRVTPRLTLQAWVYAHMQLSPEEAKEFKNAPVVYNGDVGFFFEPNE